eukprot:TRINITY_DN840_c0_g1_i2.p2 TRINITY_DN840_c0_g1~~TRINITY_DN840_c0_g1_i2.p2  ORF type:complete len:79 (-),score=10.64 TRINITY_DN840_c0_g1_i2:2-238(-)
MDPITFDRTIVHLDINTITSIVECQSAIITLCISITALIETISNVYFIVGLIFLCCRASGCIQKPSGRSSETAKAHRG